jgi:hypothetical protein
MHITKSTQLLSHCVLSAPVTHLTGIQLSTPGAKFVPLIFYHLHSIALDIYKLKKVKISKLFN